MFEVSVTNYSSFILNLELPEFVIILYVEQRTVISCADMHTRYFKQVTGFQANLLTPAIYVFICVAGIMRLRRKSVSNGCKPKGIKICHQHVSSLNHPIVQSFCVHLGHHYIFLRDSHILHLLSLMKEIILYFRAYIWC